MSLKKHYSCDLCGTSISDNGGIGVIHKARGDIEAVWLGREGAGHHLCNQCVRGLRGMLAGLDHLEQTHTDLDRAETEARQ